VLAVLLALGLMLWMTGSGINIFTIMFTVMAMVNPIKSIAQTNQQFQRYSDGGKLDLTQQKFVFVALHLVALGVGLWKVRWPTPLFPHNPPNPVQQTAPTDAT
jgi:ER membrane protein complex subunit 4